MREWVYLLVSWNCSREEKNAHEGQFHLESSLRKGLPELGTPRSLQCVRAAEAFPCSLLPSPPTSPSGADLGVKPLYQALSKGRISMKAEEAERASKCVQGSSLPHKQQRNKEIGTKEEVLRTELWQVTLPPHASCPLGSI